MPANLGDFHPLVHNATASAFDFSINRRPVDEYSIRTWTNPLRVRTHRGISERTLNGAGRILIANV